MTVSDLITEVSRAVRNSFYTDKPVRDFVRDDRAIMRAIARYGYECDRRGWSFQVEFIHRELFSLLRSIREKDAEIKYLPVYLEGAVDRHIRMRAENLQVAARKLSNITQRAVKDIAVLGVVEKTPVETLALLYRDLGQRRRTQRRVNAATPQSTQASLL
jgi:hypothetical protein